MPVCPPAPCHAPALLCHSPPSTFSRCARLRERCRKATLHAQGCAHGLAPLQLVRQHIPPRLIAHAVRPLTLPAQAFDELLLLKPGGATIYFGPLGDDSQRLIEYFQVTDLPVPTSHDSGWAAPASRPVAGCIAAQCTNRTTQAGRQADLACLTLAALQSIKGVPPCPERYNPANWWVAPLRCAVLSCAVPCRVMPCCVIPAPICAATWWAVCKGPSCMQHSAACPCLTALLHPLPPSAAGCWRCPTPAARRRWTWTLQTSTAAARWPSEWLLHHQGQAQRGEMVA